MLNGKGLQHKTKLRAADIINAKTEAITGKRTFLSVPEVSVSQPLTNTAPNSASIVPPLLPSLLCCCIYKAPSFQLKLTWS